MSTTNATESTITTGDPGAGRRAEIRAEVASAARLAAPLWPADTFIAVNPLLGLIDRPFEDAVRIARRELGASGYRRIEQFRADLESGKLTREHLRESLIRAVPGISSLSAVEMSGGFIDPIELLLADVIEGSDSTSSTGIASAAARCDALLGGDIASTVDRILSGWLAAYADEGGSAWRMPLKGAGFYDAFRSIAARDRGLRRLAGAGARPVLKALPEHPEGAIEEALTELRVPASRRADEIRAQLMRLPGWAGWVKWRSEWAGPETTSPRADMVDLVAVRITVEALAVSAALESAASRQLSDIEQVDSLGTDRALTDSTDRLTAALVALDVDVDDLSAEGLAKAHATLARIGDDDRLSVWLGAQEIAYRNRLLSQLADQAGAEDQRRMAERPSVQAVFCIDVRSEGIRRHLEEVGSCETLGFAGFFAVAIRFTQFGSPTSAASCPVLLTPAVDIAERPAGGSGEQPLAALEAKAGAEALTHAFHDAKRGVASPFALAEAGGLVAGPVGAARTFATRMMSSLHRWGSNRTTPETDVVVTAEDGAPIGFGEEEQVLFAHAALTMMGLTERFGRLVALCAHGSHTVNNPYASALDCGACGGNSGEPNARVAAAILNRAPVRRALSEQGIEIPDDTWFVAALHDTTSDVVTVLDRGLVPVTHRDDLDMFERDLALAGDRLAGERAGRIPGVKVGADRRAMAARGNDWAQVRPEWGLAGNAAFIIGSRETTRGVDLGCRTFLHSYRAECDPDGSALEVILTAPLVVAQWINSQYYFSSVDPDLFGSGDKTLHNVTGTNGILQGGGGDLRVGLPWQSVAVGDQLVHEPIRLLALVEAPLDRIERIIGDNTILQQMFGGGWISLVAREDAKDQWSVRSRGGTWITWTPARRTSDKPGRREVAAI